MYGNDVRVLPIDGPAQRAIMVKARRTVKNLLFAVSIYIRHLDFVTTATAGLRKAFKTP